MATEARQQAGTQNRESIGLVLGRIPSGVFVSTARSGDTKVGMLTSWVMQAGFEPPTVTVAVHPDRELLKTIEEAGTFSINVLAKDNLGLMKTFGKYTPDQFDNVDCRETEWGIVLNEALAVLHCRLKERVDASDHCVLIAEVEGGEGLNTDQEPFVHLRKSGFNY